ncbi:Vacuolar protein-sorting-associated protein 11 -like protein [Capsicum annuum]|uniref:Vacuolar protein sorting-associated protein 11 homolog n=1 Tax=Capsicum annuum TaxID=4072 RepID=A0A1U8FAJ4_CAPAN|nr:vacuolar protein-sorting-associated protein 11 homolog [Capsicum annuum]KAF3680671.1 Vacuolar protein-sorting-associated protein 11 -like protein [Capsicum annuum]PHT79155.1 Vacuolar protein-sorting-associated protein 11 -like protein [Capsicum annuum]
MYQWRKFEFFEEKFSGKVPDEITGKIQCCSSGKGRIVLGCDDGTASLLDRGLKFNYGFQAHSSSVLFLQQLKQRNFLVTVGEDEQMASQPPAVCLKIFDLDKMEPEGTSTSSPDCIQILRIFTNQFPEAKITSFLVLEEAPPLLLIVIGLENGSIYCIQGDIARERIKRFKLQVDNHLDKSQSSITGLGFRVDGQVLQLFAVTPNTVNLFNMHTQAPTRQTLDQIGSSVTSVAMTDRSEFIIGRPEAIYFYEVDGRGPCWAFEGEKKFLGWFRGYLLCVFADQRTGKNTFNVYDLKNRLIAHSVVVNEVSQMLCEWGNIILILEDKSTLCIGEKDMESKLDMLFKKNLYTVAINLVQSQQADAAATAEVLRKYGDHLYSKQDFDEAMAQYIHTIGHLEPSYVIQKFLDAQRIHNLTNYLEKLHEKGLASKDHTTLLLNCYTKLKAVEKLNEFIKSEDGVGEQKFDVETAIRVCRAANYHEHAMSVAKKAGRHEWYLKILLEDLGRYEEALQYISSLELSQAGVTVKEYGKILIEHKPAETVDILMRLCTEESEPLKKGSSSGAFISMLPSPIDFLNIFVHYPHALLEFLEKYTSKVKDSSAQVEIHNTLLELYLSHDLDFPTISQSNIDESGNDLGHKSSKAVSNGKAISDNKDVNDEKGRQERRQKGLTLLKSAWPSELEQPLYDVDLAVILCEMNDFKEGLLFLYEKMKLYKEVIACYMQVHDHEGLIACCKRLGDLGKGGDPSLWADLLKYFGELGEDCSKEVKEILTYIERDDILPPIVVLQTLAKNPCLTLSVIKDYIARKLEHESQLIEEDRRATEKYQEESATMRKEIQDLRTNARIFQLSKCTACTFTLDLPAVHFMCMHSFHQRCLGDNEKECPECAPEYRAVLETKRSLEQSSKNPDQFFQQVKSSKDGFSVIADYFGKGIISKTSNGPSEAIRSNSASSSNDF